MNRYLAIALVVAALVGGAYYQGRRDGEALERGKSQTAELTLRNELSALKTKTSEAIARKERELAAERRKSNARITRLLKENSSLRDWWDAAVPPAALDHAYGVPGPDGTR